MTPPEAAISIIILMVIALIAGRIMTFKNS